MNTENETILTIDQLHTNLNQSDSIIRWCSKVQPFYTKQYKALKTKAPFNICSIISFVALNFGEKIEANLPPDLNDRQITLVSLLLVSHCIEKDTFETTLSFKLPQSRDQIVKLFPTLKDILKKASSRGRNLKTLERLAILQ